MARCRCSSECACQIVAGEGITITGTGSETDPIVISLTAAVVEEVLIQDTEPTGGVELWVDTTDAVFRGSYNDVRERLGL